MFTHHIVSYVAVCRRGSERISLTIGEPLGGINEWVARLIVRGEAGDYEMEWGMEEVQVEEQEISCPCQA